jgi:hypothetical protein
MFGGGFVGIALIVEVGSAGLGNRAGGRGLGFDERQGDGDALGNG